MQQTLKRRKMIHYVKLWSYQHVRRNSIENHEIYTHPKFKSSSTTSLAGFAVVRGLAFIEEPGASCSATVVLAGVAD